ncbi:MAG: PilN domain-containing protein [Phycisphaerales bacterium]
MSRTKTLLPQEIVSRKAEFYLNITCLCLFLLVMLGTFAWFVVSSRQATEVADRAAAVNTRYAKAAADIEQLAQLEDQKSEMLNRAALAASLVERVPRSVLLAELINRMPAQVSIIEFELESEKVKPIIRPQRDRAEKGRPLAPGRGSTLEDAKAKGEMDMAPPEYLVSMNLYGVAETDQQVASFLSALNTYTLLKDVELQYTIETTIDKKVMREFHIRMDLQRGADMRNIDPVVRPRVEDMMSRGPLAPAASDLSTETP